MLNGIDGSVSTLAQLRSGGGGLELAGLRGAVPKKLKVSSANEVADISFGVK